MKCDCQNSPAPFSFFTASHVCTLTDVPEKTVKEAKDGLKAWLRFNNSLKKRVPWWLMDLASAFGSRRDHRDLGSSPM